MTAPPPPVGRYPDAPGAPRQRYFDGRDRTEYYAPLGRQLAGPPAPKTSSSSGRKAHLGVGAVSVFLVVIGSAIFGGEDQKRTSTTSSTSRPASVSTPKVAPSGSRILAVPIVCPSCGEGLDAKTGSATLCEGCGAAYPARPGRGPDLRPRSELVRSMRQHIPAADATHSWEESLVEKLRPGTGPSLAEVCADPYYSYGNRMIPEQASRLQLRPGYRLLDVGCGVDNFMRPVIAPLGVDFVGVDYSGEDPDFLVDAHVLPFPDDSFDGVLSLAVLEHVHNPYRVVQEVARVLRPGGAFAGTVAFLEPFHLESLFHHSAYGTWSVLHEAGFVNIEIAPNRNWDVARANIEMGLVPAGSHHSVRWAGSALSRAAHRKLSREPVATYARFAAGFRFVAELPR